MKQTYTDKPQRLPFPITLSGIVEHGRGIAATKLDAPTANLHVQAGSQLPPPGVYAAYCEVDTLLYRSIVNIGTKPTVTDDGIMMIEAHVLDYHGNLYGKQILLTFIYRLRDEKRFASLELLAEQLRADAFITHQLLAPKEQ